jgi:putative oxidoreductase
MLEYTNFGILVLRVIVGLLFIGHGTQKLFGWFGGGGIAGTTKMQEKLRVAPAELWAWVAGLSETFGGIGLLFGLLTPIAAALIIGVMLMAIIKVHWKNGIWNTNRGFELNLVYLTIAAVVGFAGPGIYSLDAALGIVYPILTTFLIAFAVVVLGVILGLVSPDIVARTPGGRKIES